MLSRPPFLTYKAFYNGTTKKGLEFFQPLFAYIFLFNAYLLCPFT